jgi:ABC-type transport system involved in multi-copper enzyme maturation permease subunit
MRALVSAELLKVRTTRARYAYVGVIVLLSAIATASEVGPASTERRNTLDFQLGLLDVAGIAVVIALLLGITIVTNEFRHGTITPTFLAEPRRERVVAAKAAAGVVLALLFALVSFVVIFGVALPWLSLVDAQTYLFDGEVGTRLAQVLLAAPLWALMGVAIGLVVHSQVAALVGTLVWMFLGESLLWGLFSWTGTDAAIQYLPFRALDAVDGSGGENVLSYGPGIAVSLAWIVLLGAAGTVRTQRRDIS